MVLKEQNTYPIMPINALDAISDAFTFFSMALFLLNLNLHATQAIFMTRKKLFFSRTH